MYYKIPFHLGESQTLELKREWPVNAAFCFRHSQRGFTLIELLVVIGIIGILASLLLATLARAKTSAHLIQCQSNLRQVGLGLVSYVQDHGAYPLYWDFDDTLWPDFLKPYTSADWTNRVYLCPSYKSITRENRSYTAYGNGYGPHLYGSYGYNGYDITSLSRFRPARAYVRETEVAVPVEMIALGDANYAHYDNSSGVIPSSKLPKREFMLGIGILSKFQAAVERGSTISFESEVQAALRRHAGYYNLFFADGHSERLHQRRLYDGSEHSLRMFNRDHGTARAFQ